MGGGQRPERGNMMENGTVQHAILSRKFFVRHTVQCVARRWTEATTMLDPLRDPLKGNAVVPQKYVDALERQGVKIDR